MTEEVPRTIATKSFGLYKYPVKSFGQDNAAGTPHVHNGPSFVLLFINGIPEAVTDKHEHRDRL